MEINIKRAAFIVALIFAAGALWAQGFEGFRWRTHIRDIAANYDKVEGVTRKTPDGVNPLMYSLQDGMITIMFEWDRSSGALIEGVYIIDDELPEEQQETVMVQLVTRMGLGEPAVHTNGGKYWMPSSDTVVVQSARYLYYHWTATKAGQIAEVFYKQAAGIPLSDAWGSR
jgi:hypothetical protein